MHAEMLQIVHGDHVRGIPGCNGAVSAQAVALRHVERRHAHRPERTHAKRHQTGERVVQVSFLHEVGRVLVVRTEQKSAVVLFRDKGCADRRIVGRRAAPYLNVHSARDLFGDLLRRQALVIGRHARAEIGIQGIADDARRMAIHNLFEALSRLQLFQRLRIARNDADIVHHLAQSEKGRLFQFLRRGAAIETGAARLKGRGGNTGGKLQKHFERAHALPLQASKGLGDILRPRNPAHVDELVRVGDNETRPMRNGEPRELLGREHGALHMDMGIHKTRQDDPARHVAIRSGGYPVPMPTMTPSLTAMSPSSVSPVNTLKMRAFVSTRSHGSRFMAQSIICLSSDSFIASPV